MDEKVLLLNLSAAVLTIRDLQQRVAALEKLAEDHGWHLPEE